MTISVDNHPKKLVIIGGRVDGWLAAAYLNKALNQGARRQVQITVIEGPGEPKSDLALGTSPNFQELLRLLGADEKKFMLRCDATLRQGTRYENWLLGHGERYYHPFDRRTLAGLDRTIANWMASDRSIAFDHMVSVQPGLCERGLSPRMLGTKDFSSPLPYGYHLNRDKLADFLSEQAIITGAERVAEAAADVVLDAEGYVKKIITDQGKSIDGDLFLDCSGPDGFLIKKALNAPFTNVSDIFSTNAKTSLNIAYKDYYPGFVRPFTKIKAVRNGWIADRALTNLRTIEYTYDNTQEDVEVADSILRQFDQHHSQNSVTHAQTFTPGYFSKPWSGNVITLGTTIGILDNLADTELELTLQSVIKFAEHFPYSDANMPSLANGFNEIINRSYKDAVDFIALHYALSRRADSNFWRKAQHPDHIPAGIRDKLSLWQGKLPGRSDFIGQTGLFSKRDYEYVLCGMDFKPELGDRKIRLNIPPDIENTLKAADARMPRHETWLERELGLPPFSSGPPRACRF